MTVDIPVILMSAAHARVTATSSADAVIAKPFELDTLDALIERMLAPRPRPTP
jgi:DNA-binding response OmpR family regulator